jgi:hypothetical protein
MAEPTQIVRNLRVRLTSRLTGASRLVVSFVVGLMMAIVLHYVLYRIGLPSKPFIYVAF